MKEQQKMPAGITLGSLFDGIGGFPYAASFFGIKAVWASEILPNAISITKRHFPEMEHFGDITKLHGGSLPPVDIITFGSPCQSWSVAGKRTGFAGKSGLFTEAIRIIREMRRATNEKHPRFAVFENVVGLLSCGGAGRDYQTVLEAFTEAEIPVPRSGRWANAGMVGSGGTDLAWVVYNAQYFGTAQRRRRIFLVRDFGGKRADEVLFVPKSLRGYFEAGGTPRQSAPAHAVRCADRADGNLAFACNGRDEARDLHNVSAALCAQPGMKQQTFIASGTNCMNPWDTQQKRVFTGNGASPTLAGADGGGGRSPGGLVFAAFMGGASASAGGIGYSEKAAPTLKGSSGSNSVPCLCEPKLARTLTARGDSSPCADRGQNIVAIPSSACDGERNILCAATGQKGAGILENRAPTLTCHHEQPILYKAIGVHQSQSGDLSAADTAYSLAANGNATGRNAPLVAHPKVSGTLCASGAGLSRPAGMASGKDLCVVIPDSEPIPIHDKATRCRGGGKTRNDDGCGNGLGIGKSGDPCPTLTSSRHAVAAVDCRNLRETDELSGTLQAKSSGSYSLNYQNPIRMGYIVRRLMPKECERLQGLEDGWTEYGHDGKPMSDTTRYMMLGNSLAVPCAAYIMMGIAQILGEEKNSSC